MERVYRVLLRPNLIFGIPRAWFALSLGGYFPAYLLDNAGWGLFIYLVLLVAGWFLTRFYDPFFADILLGMLRNRRRLLATGYYQ